MTKDGTGMDVEEGEARGPSRWKRIDVLVALGVAVVAVFLVGRELMRAAPQAEPDAVSATGAPGDSAGRFQFHTDEGLRYYFQTKEFAKAEREFRKSIEYRPDAALGYSNLGSALLEQGNWKDALPVLERAVALDSSLQIARNNLAWALAERQKSER